jgi:hypothetical protein
MQWKITRKHVMIARQQWYVKVLSYIKAVIDGRI